MILTIQTKTKTVKPGAEAFLLSFVQPKLKLEFMNLSDPALLVLGIVQPSETFLTLLETCQT